MNAKIANTLNMELRIVNGMNGHIATGEDIVMVFVIYIFRVDM